ncbi:MAG: sodium-dependent bicarbonate transport family permease [Bradyrhizobium sp.]|uniref:sodium-dependent bicarbonate transport family permease n=1 Tax=Bradyrhizobium sp. TaxID=376 RepID=UPI003D0EAA9A
MLSLAAQNLLSPAVAFFGLGVLASFARSDLSVPRSVAQLLALYLLMSIGYRGGAEVAHQGLKPELLAALAGGIILSFLIPFVAYALLRVISRLSRVDAASIAAHYGSISAVTLVAITSSLTQLGVGFDGYMVAVAAAMETPAIFSALLIARSGQARPSGGLLREIAFNGSIVVLLGSFVIGGITGERGLAMLKPFIMDSFAGLLCIFLLDMGLIAGRGLLQGWRLLSLPIIGFAALMPLIGAGLAAGMAIALGLSPGSAAVLMTLAASASYIAVPAAMRLALPEANAALSLTLSLGLTFPFNLTLGIPLYIAVASAIAS